MESGKILIYSPICFKSFTHSLLFYTIFHLCHSNEIHLMVEETSFVPETTWEGNKSFLYSTVKQRSLTSWWKLILVLICLFQLVQSLRIIKNLSNFFDHFCSLLSKLLFVLKPFLLLFWSTFQLILLLNHFFALHSISHDDMTLLSLFFYFILFIVLIIHQNSEKL